MSNTYLRHTSRGIVIRDAKLLVFERWRRDEVDRRPLHYFSIPGGGINENETPEQALIREMKEEMTVNVEIDRLMVRQTTPTRYHYYFLCHITDGEPVFNLGSEEARGYSSPSVHYRIAWLPLAGVSLKLHHPEHGQAMSHIIKILDNPDSLPIDIQYEKS